MEFQVKVRLRSKGFVPAAPAAHISAPSSDFVQGGLLLLLLLLHTFRIARLKAYKCAS
jgi:hypothetical protein